MQRSPSTAAAVRRRSRNLLGDNENNYMPPYCIDPCNKTGSGYTIGSCPAECCYACPDVCKVPIFNPNTPPAPPFVFPVTQLPPDIYNSLPTVSPPPEQNSRLLYIILSIVVPAAVLFFCVFLPCCHRLTLLRERRRRRRAAGAAAQPQQPRQGESEVYSGLMVDNPIWYIRTVGLHSSVINAIAVCKYKEVEAVVGIRAECAVCLNGFQEDDTLRMLPKCNHAFHVSCIDTWLKSHKNCPVCRAIIELVDIKFVGGGGGSPLVARSRPETRTGNLDDDHREQTQRILN